MPAPTTLTDALATVDPAIVMEKVEGASITLRLATTENPGANRFVFTRVHAVVDDVLPSIHAATPSSG